MSTYERTTRTGHGTKCSEAQQRLFEVVGGDLSWLRDDRRLDRVLAAQRARGLTVSVICRHPEKHFFRRDNIAALLANNIEVRALPDALRTSPYSGVVINRANPDEREAFRLRAMQKRDELTVRHLGTSHPETRNYWGKREIPGRDDEQLQFWLPLVHSYWSISEPMVLLEALPLDDPATRTLMLAALRQVPMYDSIREEDVDHLCKVNTRELLAWCLRKDKLERVTSLMQHMDQQGIDTFQPCLNWSTSEATILLPPIVEVHDNHLVVADGAHRLWSLYRKDPNSSAHVLIVKHAPPLPGKPEALTRLPFFGGRLNRSTDIRAYNAEHWRSFDAMKAFLRTEGEKRLQDRYREFPRSLPVRA